MSVKYLSTSASLWEERFQGNFITSITRFCGLCDSRGRCTRKVKKHWPDHPYMLVYEHTQVLRPWITHSDSCSLGKEDDPRSDNTQGGLPARAGEGSCVTRQNRTQHDEYSTIHHDTRSFRLSPQHVVTHAAHVVHHATTKGHIVPPTAGRVKKAPREHVMDAETATTHLTRVREAGDKLTLPTAVEIAV